MSVLRAGLLLLADLLMYMLICSALHGQMALSIGLVDSMLQPSSPAAELASSMWGASHLECKLC